MSVAVRAESGPVQGMPEVEVLLWVGGGFEKGAGAGGTRPRRADCMRVGGAGIAVAVEEEARDVGRGEIGGWVEALIL